VTLEVGDRREIIIVDNLTRTQLVQYAGASGDYNPLHSDEVFVTKVAGYPTVFAHGMLTMGATGKVLTDWFGADQLASYSARFIGQVWPGDTLTAVACSHATGWAPVGRSRCVHPQPARTGSFERAGYGAHRLTA